MSLVIDLNDLPPPSAAEDVSSMGEESVELRTEAKEEEEEERGYKGAFLSEDGTDTALPDHSFNNVFKALRRTLNLKERWVVPGKPGVVRLINQMDGLMFNPDSVLRGSKWSPRAGDVVIAAMPNTGHTIVEKMTRLLLADDFKTVLASLGSSTAPWLENAAVDCDPEVLERDQPGTGRVFRTAFAHSMVSMTIQSSPDARFIAVFRDPVHLRAVWYEHVKSVYVELMVEQTRSDDRERWAERFEEVFSFEDLAELPVTIVQNTRHSMDKHSMEYEFNIRDWMAASLERANCMAIFIEDVLTAPIAFVRRLAEFLGKESILQQLPRGATTIVEALMEDIQAEGTSRMPNKRAGQRASAPEVPFPFDLHTLSVKGVQYLDLRWGDVFGTQLPSYADLYESRLKQSYPFPLPPAFSTPTIRGSVRLTKHASMEAARSKRATLRNAMSAEATRSSADSDAGGSVGSGSSRASSSKRKTLIGRIFGASPRLSALRKTESSDQAE